MRCLIKHKQKRQRNAELKNEKEEQARFFNLPGANADFDHWSKTKYWTLDEAIALSFGKAPGYVSWETVKAHLPESPFAVKYARLRDLASRAVLWKELFDPVLPGIFIAWARRLDIDFPKELEERVIARGGNVSDWKTKYDQLKELYDHLEEKYATLGLQWTKLYAESKEILAQSTKQIEENSQQINAQTAETVRLAEESTQRFLALVEERNELLQKVQELQTEKPLAPKARDSLLKLVIGMAMDGYGYKPHSSRSPIPSEVSGNLATLGINIDTDTVRKWLNEAKEEVLPDNAEIGEC